MKDKFCPFALFTWTVFWPLSPRLCCQKLCFPFFSKKRFSSTLDNRIVRVVHGLEGVTEFFSPYLFLS